VGLGALAASTAHGQNQSPIRAAFVRLEIAIEQGVSFDKFSDLLLDAKTQLALAGPPPRKDVAGALTTAMNDAEAMKTLWAASFVRDCAHDCEARVRAALQALRLVKNDKEMDLAIALIDADFFNRTHAEWDRLLHEASETTLLSITAADKALQ
jgi:hypothetical protein